MATGDKLVNLEVLKETVQKEVVDLKSASNNIDNTLVGNTDNGLELYVSGESTSGIYWKSDGTTASGQSKCYITGYMPVTPGRKYTYSGLTSTGLAPHSVFLNSSKEYLSGSAFKQQTGTNTITAPTNAAYVSFSILGDDDATFSFISPIGIATKSEVNTVNNLLGVEPHTNLFDKTHVTTKNRLSSSGGLYSDNDYFVSGPISVTAGQQYAVNYTPSATTRVCYYQTSDMATFISKNDANSTFTAPENCAVVRFCNLLTELDNCKLYDLATPAKSVVIDDMKSEYYMTALIELAAQNGYTFNLNNPKYWDNGTIDTDGLDDDDNTRIRTNIYVTDLGLDVIKCVDGYQIMPMYYNANGTFAFYGSWTSELSGTSSYKIRLILKHGTDNIDTKSFVKVGFLKTPIASATEQNTLGAYIDNLCESRSKNEEINIKAIFDAKVQKYIDDNGDGGKTFDQMREYLLNRNNCIYRGALTKSGTNVVDENGNVVELVGIGTHDLMDYSSLHTLQSLETLKYYGINCVRLTAYVGDHSMPKSAGDDGTSSKVSQGYISATDATKEVMDDIIEKCVALGLYVIVDWHILAGDGDATQYGTEMKAFFTYFSTKYKDTDNVLYELMNEPHVNTAAQVKSLLKECYNIIRANNETAVIVTGKCSDNMSDLYSALQSEGMTDVFMSEHFYWGAGSYSPTGAIQSYISAGYPLFITEWGNANGYGDGDTNDTYANDLMTICHSNDIGECVWKLTYQPMTTAVLRFSKLAMDGGYKYGWYNDAELSHNGKLYFHTFQNYLFES